MERRRWIVLIAALLSAALSARLGWWQLDRAAQKVALQDARQAQGRLPPLRSEQLARRPADAPHQFHRQAVAEGRWLVDETVYLENRPMNGRTGFIVVTPLLLADGRALLVQRGWLPRHAHDRRLLAPYRSDTGALQVSGRIAPEPSRLYDLGAAGSGPIRQNLDLASFAHEFRRSLLPLVLVQTGSAGVDDGLLRDWPEPASDVHKHYGYAFQWFGLCALITVLYVWFQVLRPRRRATG